MRMLVFSLGLMGLFHLQGVVAQSLPQWSSEDLARLKSGELIVGAAILVDDVNELSGENASESVSPPLEPVVPLEVVNPLELDPEDRAEEARAIPEEYLDDYFSKAPGTYLIDPQRLFSNQETLDREGFLEYYADESEVDIRIYLFAADQEVPSIYSLKQLVDDRYAEGPLTAVVYYFLGNPARNALIFGGKSSELVTTERLRKMLDVAKIKAMEKSDSAAQMESFIIQLSISTYWVEQMIASVRSDESAEVMAPLSENQGETPASAPGPWANLQPYLWDAVVGTLGVIGLIVVLGGGWVLWRRSRRYYFPVLELPVRLGADHAAGIGAVMGFHNKLDSPSSQRDQIPDFLTRI